MLFLVNCEEVSIANGYRILLGVHRNACVATVIIQYKEIEHRRRPWRRHKHAIFALVINNYCVRSVPDAISIN